VAKPVNSIDLGRVLAKWLRDDGSFNSENLAFSQPNLVDNIVHVADTRHISVFDHIKILEQFDGDKELIREVLEIFLKNISIRHKNLQNAIISKDIKNILAESHTIKGMSSSVSAIALSFIAAEINDVANNENFEVLQEKVIELNNQITKFQEKIKESGFLLNSDNQHEYNLYENT
jgi:HPt (histidine-containing phosphotransfer) domain-containing protein